MNEKIVITATSQITPLGADYNEIEKALENGTSGISYIKRFNTDYFSVKHAGQIDETVLNSIEYPIEGNIQFRMFYYCLTKLMKNFKHTYSKDRICCVIGTDPSIGTKKDFEKNFVEFYNCISENKISMEDKNNRPAMVDPMLLNYYAAKDFGICGPFLCNFGTCAAATQAIGTGMDLLRDGVADLAIVGAVSSKIDPISFSRLCRLGALEDTKDDLEDNCCPFDKRRSGFTMSEGCILFTLERESNAILRENAVILAEISGYGGALDGCSMTNPHDDALGMILSMERALEDANLRPTDIDYINAHGTGTAVNDVYETRAIKEVFGDYAKKVSISSTKSMHGHLMHAAGAMEVLCSILAIQNSIIFPTIHYNVSDPECDLDYTPNKAKKKHIDHVLSNNFGLGGQNASLVISRYKGKE